MSGGEQPGLLSEGAGSSSPFPETENSGGVATMLASCLMCWQKKYFFVALISSL